MLEQGEADLEAARAEQGRLGTDRQRAVDEADQLRATLAEREQSIRDEGNRLRDEAGQLKIERDRLRSEVEDIRRSLDELEHNHRVELSRRDEQLREVAHARDSIRAEGDQLRNEIDGLRRALEDAEQSRRDEIPWWFEPPGRSPIHREDAEQGQRDEIGRLNAELAAMADQRRQLQERHEAAEQSSKELRERNQELQADRDRLRSAPPTPASDDELQAARAEIETLKRKLDISDEIEREQDRILRGMGIRVLSDPRLNLSP